MRNRPSCVTMIVGMALQAPAPIYDVLPAWAQAVPAASEPPRAKGASKGGRRQWLLGRGGVLLAATLAVAAGCASMQPEAGSPIADVGVIAGKWAGTTTPGDLPFYLTINPGGTLTAAWGSNMAWGTVTTRGGKASFEMQPSLYEGSIRLYEDGGTRRLVLNDLWASFNARVVPE